MKEKVRQSLRIKSSRYNIFVPIEELNEYLLFNTVTGGLEVLGFADGEYIEQLSRLESFRPTGHGAQDESLRYLYKNNYLINADYDETDHFYKNYTEKRRQSYSRETGSIFLTVATTITCNMGCPYCFEAVKPNLTLKDENNISHIITYLRDMIKKSPVKKWESFNVTWYGGEPLINKSAIEKLTPHLIAICEEYGIDYSSGIVTNGILLNDATWKMLVDNRVKDIQVTIDGPKELHDKFRPLKGKEGKKNYEQIMENLANKPEQIKLNIRVNTDKRVAEAMPRLLDDLCAYGIWPQQYATVTIQPAWLRTFEEANEKESEVALRLNGDEFCDVLLDFRKLQMKFFNEWAKGKILPKAKLKWHLPEFQRDECATWVSPYGLVIDPEGFIHKCWETVHDKKGRLAHVSDGYDINHFTQHVEYDRFKTHEECYSCQFLPVCDQLTCSKLALDSKKLPCTYWKTKAPDAIRRQYLYFKKHPDEMLPPGNLGKVNKGHTNK